jgi:hypothetical protein
VDSAAQRTIASFRSLVESAEAAVDRLPKAELARFQLQGLSATLGQLGGDTLPSEVAGGLDAVRAYVERVGGIDRDEGARLRDKVQAYVVLADDHGLDAEELEGLVHRWDAAMAPATARGGRRAGADAPARSSARRAPSGEADQECPVCGQRFRRVAKHLSSAHPEEWARRKGA